MYTKEHFSLSETEMHDFVRSRSFGVLAGHHEGEVLTSPLPLDLRTASDDSLFIAGHVARANDMTAAIEAGAPVSITFMGPDTYVPAEWFGTRDRIPTWFYCAVELRGQFLASGPELTRADVEALIERLQKNTVEGSTWTLDEMPPDLTEGYLKHIVGFRVHEPRFRSCFRLNQGKGGTGSLVEALEARGDTGSRELARLVLDPPTARGGGRAS